MSFKRKPKIPLKNLVIHVNRNKCPKTTVAADLKILVRSSGDVGSVQPCSPRR
jgi:hypothetical protein